MPSFHGCLTETYFKDSRGESEDLKQWLAVSPYTVHPHLLDLDTVTISQRLLAKALRVMAPVRSDYATAPYQKSFNWDEVIRTLKELTITTNVHWIQQTFYLVVFRSRVLPSTDRIHLAALDQRSHAEAMRSGGLLKYWFGVPDENYRNLATCEQAPSSVCKHAIDDVGIWSTFEDAKAGGRGEGHREAARTTMNLYSEWRVERLKFEIGENTTEWSIRSWDH